MRVLADRRLTFWTMTAWDDVASMKAYRGAGFHKSAMPRLAGWCDEASYVRWADTAIGQIGWDSAWERMLAEGIASHLTHPSPAQLAREWARPR